jgi:S-(hydroxymethyl)glutathione dehydrogenase/alcohol dehydrogenase
MQSFGIKIKAAVLTQLNMPLEILSLDVPELLPGQVLVKIMYSGVCRSQLMEVQGDRGVDSWIPHLLGHEGSGVVVDIGPGVTKVTKGDDVILGWLKGDGMEAPGAKYLCNGRVINSGKVTTFSNYSIVSENRLTKKPKDLPFDLAVLFGCALPTGVGMVINQLRPDANHSVAIIGLGGIGLSSLIALKALNVKKIVAIDVSSEKLEFAKIIGATHTINLTSPSSEEALRIIQNEGLDGCIESAGSVKTIEMGFSLLNKKHGTLIFASHPAEGEKIQISPHELIGGKKIFGSWGGLMNPDMDTPKVHKLIKANKVGLKLFIPKKYSLENINQALSDLKCGTAFRPLIEMEHCER